MKALGSYEVLGGTLDDAAGETFDKVARLLGLSYPGGPAIERYALKGDENRFSFPRPLIQKPGFDFSFSGLKTAVLRTVEELGDLSDQDKYDIAASFQKAVAMVFKNRLKRALDYITQIDHVVIAGGVAANQYLRGHLEEIVAQYQKCFVAPPLKYCTDNGAMVAWAGLEYFQSGHQDPLTFKPRPRWPLGT